MQPRSVGARKPGPAVVIWMIALLVVLPPALAQKRSTPADAAAPAGAGTTIDRVRARAKLRIGYRTDARPFSYRAESGDPAGYSVELCRHVAEDVRREVPSGQVTVDWVPVTASDRFQAVQRGDIDLLCGADTITLSRRADISFSIPIFPGGVGALLRADAPAALREVLAGRAQPFRPTWRASATRVLQSRFVSAVAGTTAERWLNERLADLNLIASVSRVSSYQSGVEAVRQRRSDVLFGERAILLDAATRHPSPGELMVVDRLFTYEPLALALDRDDEAFRLLVDRALSRLYGSGDLIGIYRQWFGEPDAVALPFYRWNTLTD